MVREVQPLISSGCLKKGVVGIVIFVVVWFILVLLLYSVMFIRSDAIISEEIW